MKKGISHLCRILQRRRLVAQYFLDFEKKWSCVNCKALYTASCGIIVDQKYNLFFGLDYYDYINFITSN